MGAEKDTKFSFINQLEAYSKEREKTWKGNFREYLELVAEKPELGRFAHKYVYDGVVSFGVELDRDGNPIYKLFETGPYAIYGADDHIRKLMMHMEAASQGGDARKRAFVIMGPPGSGKTTIVNAIKWGVQEYSRTDEGAMYAIKDCPQFDDPLKLVPEGLRQHFRDEFGVTIEGHVCPQCQHRHVDQLQAAHPGDWMEHIQIQRVYLSEQNRVGIGTFWAGDPKSQELSELIGKVDLRSLGSYGVANHPEAYSFDGEFNKANRGIMEFGEMFRANEEFLRPLLTLTTERNFKIPGFAMVHADMVVLGHTNQASYERNLVNNKESEALRRRVHVIDWPYTLQVSQEERIYRKLLAESESSGIHISPDVFPLAATWALLSRLGDTSKADLMQKIDLYDGCDPDIVFDGRGGVTKKELMEDTPGEGMDGISPTYVVDTLSIALTQSDACLNPIDAVNHLRESLRMHTDTREMSPKHRERIAEMFDVAVAEFENTAKHKVQKAFVYAFEDQAQALFDNYIQSAIASQKGKKITDPITGKEHDPDEALMRSLEERMGVGVNQKKEFRLQVLADKGIRGAEGSSYTSYPKLREAISKKLFDDMKDYIVITTNATIPNEEQQRKFNEVVTNLVEHQGYCPHCANHLLRYVGTLLKK